MMKKISFPLITILLVSIIITLVGYNTLTLKKESEKYQELQNQYQNTSQSSHDASSNQTNSSKIKVYCIGDSLTLKNQSISYPSALAALTGFSVDTFGGMNDQTIDIAIRMGKTKIYCQNMTIPAKQTAIPLDIYDEDGDPLDVLKGSGQGMSQVSIDGISGVLKYDSQSQKHTFTRDEDGKETKISKLTQITAEFPKFDDQSIAVIFTGTYDPYSQNSIFRTITYQRAIINQLKTDKYIVVSLTSKRNFTIVDDMNRVLKQEHQDHFLDFRSYLLEHGLADAKISPTSVDQADLNKKYIPSSLLQEDLLNGNDKFNELLAQQIIEKMLELKYIDQNDLK